MAKHGDTITDGGVSWKVVDTRIYGYIADIPNFYERSGLFKANNSDSAVSITTPEKLLVNINNHGYIAEATTLNLGTAASWDTTSGTNYTTAANRAGKDFYIYAVEQDGDVPKFLLSANATVPTGSGYTANNTRKIGGFHCLGVAATGISDTTHPLKDYAVGWILPLSVWDLRHRPVSDPEGMVWVEGIGKWVDIYLNSWDTTNSKLVSKYKGATADGGTQNGQIWHGEKFAEKLGLIGKHLPMRDDFVVFAKGSNEGTAITGANDKVYAGGWTDTAGRRMISNYGIEDCCGFLWQWTSDVEAIDTFLTQSYDASNWSNSSIYNSSVDSQEYGSAYGNLHRACVGGSWDGSSYCGSRCVSFNYVSSNVYTHCGARGASEPRKFE